MMIEEADELRMLRESVRRFVDKEMPREKAREWDRYDAFPRDVFKKFASLGITGLAAPEEFGGTGPNVVALIAVIEELSKRSLAMAGPYIMCTCYAGMNLLAHGSPEQKDRMMPLVVKGELLFSYGLTEPDVGGDLASVRTRAVRQGDRIVVNGAKRFCSGANFADYIYCLVRSGPENERHRNLSFVLVPATAPGVTVRISESIGIRGTPTTDVTFDNVEVGIENVVGGIDNWNNGWSMLTGAALNIEKLEVGAMALGLAEAAVSDAWEYAQQRVQFGRIVSSFQAIRHTLADLRTDLLASRLMLYHAAALYMAGRDCSAESSMAKLFVTERARNAGLEAQRVMGAYGLTKEFDMERYVRDLLVMAVGGGSSNIQRNNISNLLGLARN